MSLTQGSQKKQIVGIILVAVFILAVFVYGTRGYRGSRQDCAVNSKKVSSKVETCQAENGNCPLEITAVR